MAFTPRTATYFYTDDGSMSYPYAIPVDKPSGTAEGDILFCCIAWFSSGKPDIANVPDGWTLIAHHRGNYDAQSLYYKVAGASEPSSYTWNLEGPAKTRMVCSCYTGGDFDANDPIDVYSNTEYKVSNTTVRAASMSVSATDSPLVFWATAYYYGTIASFTKPSSPGTWNEDDDAGDNDSQWSTEVCSQIWSSSGATGVMDATCSETVVLKHAFAVALNPAAAGGVSVTPSPASAIAQVVAPTVLISGITVSPSPASAVCGVVAPKVLERLIATITTDTHELSSSYLSQRKLVRTTDGVLHAVYERNDESYKSQIYHSYSSDGGKNWQEEAITSGGYNQNEPSIAVDSHDNLHVVWVGYSSESPNYRQIRYRKYDGSWGSISNLTSGNYHQRYPSIAIDSSDYLHVVWHGLHSGSTTYNQIRYIKYTTSWSSITNLTSASYGNYEPSIAIDSSDYIHVVWSGNNIEYRKYTDSWQDIVAIDDSIYSQDCPCIAVDGNDYVHVVWFGYHSESTSYPQIRYRKYTNSWQSIENLTSGDYGQNEPSIAVDSNNYLHVVWYGESPENPLGYTQIRHIKYTNSWGSVEDLTSVDQVQYYPNLLCAGHPNDRETPESGFAFIWVDDTTLKYYASGDLAWGNEYCLPEPVCAIASVVAPTVIEGAVIISPGYVKAIAQVVQPAIKLGNITFSPAPVAAICQRVNPAVVLGSLSLSPGFVKAIAKGINPTTILGSTTATPEYVKAIAGVIAPIVSGGVVYVTPDPASAIAQIVAPTVVLSSITITPDEAYAIGQVVAPTVKLGSIIISNGIAEAVGHVVQPTVIKGSLSIEPEYVEAIARGENPEVIMASMTVTPEFVKAVATAIDPTVLQTWIGRKLKVVIVTTQKRKVNVLTTQYRKVDVTTSQKRKVRVLTGE